MMEDVYDFRIQDHTSAIRKDHKNILNRLLSIKEDANFVRDITILFPHLALIANERCGSWYIDSTQRKVHSAYFKSTDGHMGQWDFNLRRNNLHLIPLVSAHEGCIIVDSTRRGKRIPDALSKTVPIWCCTINRAIQKYRQTNESDWDTRFHSLPSVISRSEHAQMEALIDGFAQRLLDSGIPIEPISRSLKKPLRPIWITPQSTLFTNDPPRYDDAPFWPVICLSASPVVESGCQARPGYLYVQGSGDDQESWSCGLTPKLFWKHQEDLLSSAGAEECETKARSIVNEARERIGTQDQGSDDEVDDVEGVENFHYIGSTRLAIGTRSSGKPPNCWLEFDKVINCTPVSYKENESEVYKQRYLQLSIPKGKKGQHKLLESIPVALAFVRQPLMDGQRVLVHCAQDQDRSVGIALSILVKYFDEHGSFCPKGGDNVDKRLIQKHLMQIISSHPMASPSRVTLKKVNTYFMSPSKDTQQ